MAIYLPSHKLSKKVEQDTLSTAKVVRTNSSATFSSGLLQLDTPVLADQQNLTFICANTNCRLDDLTSVLWLFETSGVRDLKVSMHRMPIFLALK